MEEKQHFKLTISGKGKDASFDVEKDVFILGRGKECDVVVDDDLVSRRHLKITIEDGVVTLEELGSTNGTLINNIKMEKGQKVTYHSKSKILLGGSTGLLLGFEKVATRSNVVKINSQTASSQRSEEKTVVVNIPELKVANGPSISVGSAGPIAKVNQAKSSSSVVVNSPPAQPSLPVHTSKVSASKPHPKEAPVKKPAPKSIKLVPNPEEVQIKRSFDQEVKNLVSQEAEKLRKQSVKDAEYIKKRALEEERNIVLAAKDEAHEIIEQAKREAVKNRQDAEDSIVALREKVRATQLESDNTLRALRNTISDLEEKVSSLRQVESGHTQRIRHFEDEYSSIKERVKNENLLLEELKLQSSTVKKSADLKLEEILMQERRSRATIETEIAEAKTQTAKIFAEAEKATTQRSLLEPEIQQLKTEKSKIEKDINEAQINYKRAEYDLEKAHKDQGLLNQEINEARARLEELHSKAKIKEEMIAASELQYLDKEKSMQLKLENAELSTHQIIENAHNKAKDIILEAQNKSQKIADQNAKAMRDLENHKLRVHDDLEAEKKIKIQSAQNEIERMKEAAQGELDKIETKKTNLVNELKWMETNTAATCEKLVNQAKTETQDLKTQTLKNIEIVKASARQDAQTFKERVQKEVVSLKENAALEVQNVKREAGMEIAAMKNKVVSELTQMKFKAEEEVKIQRNEVIREQNKAKEEIKSEQLKLKEEAFANEELKKTLQLAIEKTNKMMNDNHIEAEKKVKQMLEDAQKKAQSIEQEGRDLKAKELSVLAEIRRSETDKIEEMKAQFEDQRINAKREEAETVSANVQELIVMEMIKSRNLPLDDKLIKKLSEKVKVIASDATLGKIQSSNGNVNDLYSKAQKTDYAGMFKIILAVAIMGGIIYAYKTYPKEMNALLGEARVFLKDLGIELP